MQSKLETTSFLWLLIFVTLAFIWVLTPFFGPIFWAVAIAILFSPSQKWVSSKMRGKPNTAALCALLFCVVVVIIPVLCSVLAVINEVSDLYQNVEDGSIDLAGRMDKLEAGFPKLEHWFSQLGIDVGDLKQKTSDAIAAGGKFAAQHIFTIGQNTFAFALDIGVMLYVAFFLLRDGEKLTELSIKALPLGDDRERLLFVKFAEVTRATVKGNMVVAIIQGTLGGIIFGLLGIPGALIWGVIMALTSLIPAVGAAIVWLPIAIYLLVTGSVTQGIILIAFGSLVIGLVDNLLRPILVGRDTKLPDYVVLLSTLGGLTLFGVNGFVMGPLIAALFVAFWGIFMRDFQDQEFSEAEKKALV